MIVVSDTTPIISLLKVHQIDLLEKLFGKVILPAEVYEELTVDNRFYKEIADFQECDFFEIEDCIDDEILEKFKQDNKLDAGESAALIWCEKLAADLILMDEKNGRDAADTMNLKCMGTIGIIAGAYRNRLLSKQDVISIVLGLQKSGRFISDGLYKMLMETIEE
ncbi:MAG: DUF3368 domain-containing protein [Spirochaetales bacterium]|nr:DUF3368 domain-containing protein [Spirochaetales bacterium]